MARPLRAFSSLCLSLCLLPVLMGVKSYAQEEATGLSGQEWRGDPGFSRMYDPATVVTVSGKVTSVEEVTSLRGVSVGVHMVLKTDLDAVSVHLGPSWFVKNLAPAIAPGDNIQVKGSQVDLEGEPAIIASEIITNNRTLQFRDANGRPLWSGGNN